MTKKCSMTAGEQTIIASAKEEFIKKGFKDASMRVIAKQAGMTVGNVYNYFQSKDDLFCRTMQPLIEAIDAIFAEHNSEHNLSLDVFFDYSYQSHTMNAILELTDNFASELKLLWFCADGSSLAGYKDALVTQQTAIGIEYLRLMHDKYPQLSIDISPFFLHLTSTFWITLIGEMIRNSHLTREEKQQAIGEYIRYGVAGWKTLMHV
ncbi:MAG TPA: TetR family transcriptional regulator [Porphyromonadaceae bacterium]|jgi:AcrR family transcriptional regulator|nr:TetR family transcriptional regulator [Porphyromonadaceae bacterium]HBL33599.1 TetR family transcriptional regulator [Porphyromonadaceae bacterium]HBX19353.1 TetR family transcriptional regulator [Porphyromonadaceae bacterium]HCM20622.1 TetR family transcriptional regulator [Porphyromonadaceae bacterium]